MVDRSATLTFIFSWLKKEFTWESLHGITMEAVKFTSTITDSASSWSGQSRSYANSYATPVVLGQVMSANDPDFSVFWSRAGGTRENAPNGESLKVGKHVGEDTDRSRAAETIGYVVMEAGSGTIDGRGYVARRGGDTILGVGDPSRPDSYSLRGLPTAVTAVATQTGMDGANGGWAVLYGENPVSATRLNLAIDEDQAKDAERIHTNEQVAYFVMEAQETPVEQFGVAVDNSPAQNSAALQLAIDSVAADGRILQFHGDYVFAANSPAARVANGSNIHDGVAAAIIAPNTKIDFNSHTQTVVLTEPVTVDRIYFLSGSETQPADDILFKNGFISDGTTGSPLNTKHASMVVFNLIESDGVEILNVYGGANNPRALLTSAGSHNGVIQLDNPLQMKLGWFAFSEQWTVSDLVFTNASSQDELIDLDAGNSEMNFGTIVVIDDAKLLREVVDINGSSNINIQSIETDGARAVLIASKATYANFAQFAFGRASPK